MFFSKDLEHVPLIHHKVDATTASGILALRKRINVPDPVLDASINVATWNIREFGRIPRRKESIEYIAEIISYFDLVAITELRQKLGDLEKVMRLLGPYWKAVYSDITFDRGGNRERIAYLYDQRVMKFTGLAAEADPLRKKNKKTGEYEAALGWWRSPYLASFRAGKFDFVVITVHMRWGDSKDERKKALKRLAEWVDKRQRMRDVRDKDILVMGDFNIPKVGDPLYEAVTSKGLKAPKQLLKLKGTNISKNKNYDQILYYPRHTQNITAGGSIDFYRNDFTPLYPKAKYPNMTKDDFTFQMSDHLPIWIQLDVWTEDEDLKKMAKT